MTEADPGTGGKKLSKSDSEAQLEARNKSKYKVVEACINYVRARHHDTEDWPELRTRWLKKAEYHEKEYGW